jgi:hypothetical protein
MTAYVIKFQNGTYYAGYGKSDAKTLLGAQLYQSEKKAKYIMEKTSDFHYRRNEKTRIVPIQMREIESYGTTGRVYFDEFFDWTNEVLNG